MHDGEARVGEVFPGVAVVQQTIRLLPGKVDVDVFGCARRTPPREDATQFGCAFR
jgi:hypothetical protein